MATKTDKAPAKEDTKAGVTLSSPGNDGAKKNNEPKTSQMPGGTTRIDY